MDKKYFHISFIILLISCNTPDWTDDRLSEAINFCTRSGNPTEFCECSVDILSAVVTYDEFSEWNNQILAGQHPTGEVVSKMMSVGKKVVEECQSK
tara:strand:- start:130 stop:417 length:288 start_codon:yes stop_codon:yes gene_type:complete